MDIASFKALFYRAKYGAHMREELKHRAMQARVGDAITK